MTRHERGQVAPEVLIAALAVAAVIFVGGQIKHGLHKVGCALHVVHCTPDAPVKPAPPGPSPTAPVIWRAAFGVTVCTSNCVVRRGQAFSLAVDHDGMFTAGYRLYENGAIAADLPVTVLQPPGVVTFAFPAGIQRRDTYQFVFSAYDSAGHEVKTDPPFQLVVNASGK